MKKKNLELEKLSIENSELNGAKYYRIISEKMKQIHSSIPKDIFDITKIASSDIREEYFQGKNHKRLVLYLMSNGCEWALKSGNGCTICGHLAKQTRECTPLSSEDYLKQFISEIGKYDFKDYPILNLYNNGSFLNDNEIPSDARKKILSVIANIKGIKMLVIETRPEFVTLDKILEIKQLLPNIKVEIAVGLETYNDSYRSLCINKGFSLCEFERAAKIIVENLYLRTYVLLKPPFLTEKESIDEAVKTINYAFSIGASTVSLEACTIQDYTLVNYLYQNDSYSPVWLWSIIEVVKRTAHLGKVVVGLFQFYPTAEKVPYNCDNCSDKILEQLIKYNHTLDIRSFTDFSCDCKKKWEEVLKVKDTMDLKDRIIQYISK